MTPARSTYANVTGCPLCARENSAQAPSSSSIDHFAMPGISFVRSVLVVALSDTASSVARPSFAYRRIIGTTPAVDTVIRDGDRPNACGSMNRRTEVTTAS